MTWKWLADRLVMGSWTNVSNLLAAAAAPIDETTWPTVKSVGDPLIKISEMK